MTAARDYDDLHHLVDRLNPRQADRLRVLVASDPELAPAAEPEGQGAARRHLSITGIWEWAPEAPRVTLLLDTGPVVAAIDRSDNQHDRCAALLESAEGPLLIPTTVIVEVCWLVDSALSAQSA